MNRFNEEIWSIQNTISYYTNILHKREDSLTGEQRQLIVEKIKDLQTEVNNRLNISKDLWCSMECVNMTKCTCGLSDPKQIRYKRFLLEIINEKCDEEEYLNGLLDSIRISVKESRKVLSQYDLEEEHIKWEVK